MYRVEARRRLRLRWFTPSVEVDLCGHATLATAHVLWEEGTSSTATSPLCFETRSGLLTAPLAGRLDRARFPRRARRRPRSSDPGELDAISLAVNSPVRLGGPQPVRPPGRARRRAGRAGRSRPTSARVAAFPVRGVIVTSRAVTRVSTSSRGSSPPRSAIDEDPGLRLGPLLPGPLLGREAGTHRADRPPGLAPRRGRQGAGRRPPRCPHRAGRHGDEGGTRWLGRGTPASPGMHRTADPADPLAAAVEHVVVSNPVSPWPGAIIWDLALSILIRGPLTIRDSQVGHVMDLSNPEERPQLIELMQDNPPVHSL